MTFFSDSRETVSRFGGYIDELQDFFRSSGVAFGVPDNFFAFARRVQKDTQLRANLSVLAQSIMERESQVSLRTILTILAVASGGPDVATSDREINTPVNLIIDFLISVGGCSRISAEHPDSPCSESIVDPDETSLDRSSTGHSPLATHPDTFSSNTLPGEGVEELILQPTFASSLDPIPADSHATVNILTKSLTRLELNSLELKLYLDSIDQRISRMEPRLENIPSLVLPAAPQHPSQNVSPHVRDTTDAKFSAALLPPTHHNDSDLNQYPIEATRQNEVRKEVESNQAKESKPEPEPTGYRQTNKSPEILTQPWIRSRHLFSSGKEYIFPILLLCAALLLAGMVYRRLGRHTTQAAAPTSETLQPITQSLPSETQKPSATFTDPSNTNSNHVAKSDQIASPQSTVTVRRSRTSTPGSHAPLPPSTSLYNESSAAVATNTTSSTPEASPEPAPVAATRWSPTELSNRRVNVSSGIMAANLLSAPKPAYPKLASLTHTQGNVVMQAIISKKGTVENLHVIKGHHLLRGAATSAVRTWRFRPYLVDGVPVEVATIVSVDFARH